MRILLAAAVLTTPLLAQVLPTPQRLSRQKAPRIGTDVVACARVFWPQAQVLVDGLKGLGATDMRVTDPARSGSILKIAQVDGLGPEEYTIEPRAEALQLSASTTAGAARGCATLLLLAYVGDGKATWPTAAVRDEPDMPYRSFMIDMGRNPHSPKTLRHVLDLMWLNKANLLQLHLSDDQLFSWPSKAFPELLSKNAGWTLKDFIDLEAYAQARGVRIIPELDVPGHSTILRRAYPEVFGETPTDLATLESAQKGVETLLGEMLDVFSSATHVHVGGDEAYGVPEEKQRDFINRLNDFVKSRGRRTVVWEGPRLGKGNNKVDTDVLHINWRTINFPAQEMLDAGYKVVNAAWDPMYIVDHYPRTMFTAVPLLRCLNWDPTVFAHVNPGMPTFDKPHKTNTSKGIAGFCMPWWEGREENLMPLCAPRLAAVACKAWNREDARPASAFFEVLERSQEVLEALSGYRFPSMPVAPAASQADNKAYLASVDVPLHADQPHFGCQRLTNGIPDRFDHFLGYPTTPEPLPITLKLREAAIISRIIVHERAVRGSHELYDLLVSSDGESFEAVATTTKDSRGKNAFVEHRFEPRKVSHIRVLTRGCHGLTFPSFSRLCEVEAFEK